MGCGGSKKHNCRRSSVTDYQVSIHIGDEVKVPTCCPTVLFVFGGPGSKKGRLVSELVETYDFHFINVEKILLTYLIKKVPEGGSLDRAYNVQDVIKEDSQMLSLGWLLEEVSRQMTQIGKSSNYIVDIMPNLRFLIKNESFLAECSKEMKAFEQKHQIAFAINFVQKSGKRHKKSADTAKKEEKVAACSDEADLSRTKRRITLFENNVQPFIDYFKHSDRLVTLDVTGARMDLVWARLCELFSGLHLSSQVNANFVYIFLFDAAELHQVNEEQYNVHTIKLRSLLNCDDFTMEEAVRALHTYLSRFDPISRAFAIDVTETSITKDLVCQTEGQSIMFVDEEGSQLEKFLDLKKAKVGPCPLKFKAVASTGNTVCLFPCHVPMMLCKDIALALSRYSHCTNNKFQL